MRYDFSFGLDVDLGYAGRSYAVAMVQAASGSVMYDDRTKYLGYDKHSAVGKGGLLIEPYLDLNGNGKRDPGEPRVSGVTDPDQWRRNVQDNTADTTTRVSRARGLCQLRPPSRRIF
jgi:hypothetical protein